ncbi:MAG: hypothetical protein ABI282_05780 [Candidatus Baltobacteraceae bacterium]
MSFQKFAPARSGWKINEYAVAGRYAVVGFYCSNGGVTALLVRETAGNWVLVTRGGAQITPDFMVRAIPAMEISVAQRLYDLVMSQDRP